MEGSNHPAPRTTGVAQYATDFKKQIPPVSIHLVVILPLLLGASSERTIGKTLQMLRCCK